MAANASFWDRTAERYAKQPIKDQASYEATLDRVRTYLSEEDNVLEVGCGTGSTALLLANRVARYRGTDISAGMIDIARRKARDANVSNLSFGQADVAQALTGDSYDVILGFNLLHLLETPQDDILSMRDALRRGGYLITKTVCLKGRGFHLRGMIAAMQLFGKAPHVGFHSVDDVDDMMRRAGLEIVETGNYPAKPPSRFVVARRP